MKNKTAILSILITGIICLLIGAYIGHKIIPKEDVRPLLNIIATQESYELSRKAILLEALNKGKTQEVIETLYIMIKIKLKQEDEYHDFELLDDTMKTVNENRKKAKDILDRYPNPKINEWTKSNKSLEQTGGNRDFLR